jgi:hypothetical protein
MAIDFPSSPALNDTYTEAGKTWRWNGTGWQLVTAGTVTNADISATAEIAVSKLADGSARQLLQTDAAGTGVEWTSNVDVPGTLDVTGAAVFDSTVAVTGALTKSGSNVVTVGDTGTVSTTMLANDAITYAKLQNVSATDRLLGRSTAGAGDVEEITCTAAGRALLDDADATAQRTTLGLGTLATQSGTFSGTSSGTNTGDQTITLTGDVTGSGTGSITAAIAAGVIVNADVNASAAIAGTKISPDFGSQNVVTTGTATAASLNPTDSSVPANGVYLPGANRLGIATNTTARLEVDAYGKLLSPNGAAFFGTVSNSGNGAIMEFGSNANGEFVKYADGTMICTGSVTENRSASGVRQTNWTMPAAFISVTDYTPTAVPSTSRPDIVIGVGVIRNSSTVVEVYADRTNSTNTTLQVAAIGRWY